MKNNLILKEGYKSIAIIFIVAIFLNLFVSDCLGTLGILLGLFVVYIYRGSNRHIFTNTQSVLAPIDSTITAIDKVNGKYKIYCKVGLLDNHIVRAPCNSTLKVKKHRHGLNLNVDSYKASLYNEQIVLKFEDIKLKFISGFFDKRVKKIQEKEVVQGDKISIFIDGVVVISVPQTKELLVQIGDKLTSGQTILFKK